MVVCECRLFTLWVYLCLLPVCICSEVLTADEVADTVVGILDKLGVKEACVVGHSYGGYNFDTTTTAAGLLLCPSRVSCSHWLLHCLFVRIANGTVYNS